MPFVSEKDNKGFERVYSTPVTPYEDPLDPTFGEAVSAAFGSVVDEGLTISRFLNQGFRNERLKRTQNLIRQGVINRETYQDQSGLFDFNRLHRDLRGTDYDGLIDADYQVREKRNEMLRKRREGRDAILAEGSGMAQFIGMGGAYMFAEPVSLLTLPIGTVAAAHRGLTATALSLNAAKNTAALNAASELAIQPFVYAHKEDIESPYSFQDAVAAVGFAAAGGAALGAVAGGITGYFRKVKARSNEELARAAEESRARGETPEVEPDVTETLTGNSLKAVLWAREQGAIFTTSSLQKHLRIGYNPTREIIEDLKAKNIFQEDDAASVSLTAKARSPGLGFAGRAMDDVADYVEQANATKPKSPARLVDDEHVKVIENQKPYEKARDDARKSLEAEHKKLSTSSKLWVRVIAEFGGLNKKAWEAEGIDEAAWKGVQRDQQYKTKKGEFKTRKVFVKPKGYPKNFWQDGDEGLTPDGLVEILRERQDLGVFYERFDDVTQAGTDEVMQLVESLVENRGRFVDDTIQDRLDQIDSRIDELDNLSDDELKAFFSKNSEEVMKEDVKLLTEFEEGRLNAAEPARMSDDFPPPDDIDAPVASVTGRERELLEDAGYAESLDEAMAQYQALADEKKIFTIDGEEIDFDDLIKEADEQLEVADALRRCVYGE